MESSRSSTIRRRAFWAGAALLVVVLFAVALIVSDDPEAVTPTELTEALTEDPPYEVTAGQLIEAFQSGQPVTRAQYAGKPLLVSGRLESVLSTVAGALVVQLGTSDGADHLRAVIVERTDEEESELPLGEPVALRCSNVSGAAEALVLEGCRLF